MAKLAFYKAKGGWIDKVIRWGTRAPHSHVELVDDLGVWWTSSHRDGGVRAKMMTPRPGHWDYIDIPDSIDIDWRPFIKANSENAKYDYAGIMLSQMISMARHNPNKWFCSEICAASLGFESPHTISPGRLYELMQWQQRHGG